MVLVQIGLRYKRLTSVVSLLIYYAFHSWITFLITYQVLLKWRFGDVSNHLEFSFLLVKAKKKLVSLASFKPVMLLETHNFCGPLYNTYQIKTLLWFHFQSTCLANSDAPSSKNHQIKIFILEISKITCLEAHQKLWETFLLRNASLNHQNSKIMYLQSPPWT